MSKIEVSQAAEIIKKYPDVSPSTLREIVEEMNALTQPADEEEKPPAVKKQFVFLLSDATGKIKERIDANNLVGWVVQIPEDASPHSTCERIFKGAYDFNASKRGRLLPVKSVGESLESVTAKYFKEANLWVKTKMPIGVIVTDNVLPRDTGIELEKVTIRKDGKTLFDSSK